MSILDTLPYLASVLCAVIAGVFSYMCAKKQAKAEIAKLDRQFSIDLEKEREKAKLDLEQEREKNKMEIERLHLQHQHELEMKDKETQNSMGESVVTALISEMMKMPEMKKTMSDSFRKSKK